MAHWNQMWRTFRRTTKLSCRHRSSCWGLSYLLFTYCMYTGWSL